MTSTPPRVSANNDNSSSPYRVNYSEYVADITGSPKTARKSAVTGIGHHINPIHNPYSNRQLQPTQEQPGAMPQYGGGNEKCARCAKTVYAAEKKTGAGRSFHSSCFSCHTCKRKLDSTALSEHKGEIYCRPCYTKQFGAHGLISGVTMSTEHTPARENYHSRRASSGDDLDTPTSTYPPVRRTNSVENTLSEERRVRENNQYAQKYPRQDDVFSEQTPPPPPAYKRNNSVNAIVDTHYQRSPSPSALNRDTGLNTDSSRHRSTYAEEDDRSKYIHQGERLSYGSGTGGVVNIPIVRQDRRSDVPINPTPISKEPTRENQRSRSPSVTSNDSYQRQSSRERQTDPTDEYSRLSINENNSYRNDRKYSNDNTINPFGSENTSGARQFYHSSSSSYETTYRNSTTNPSSYTREQIYARDSSPSATVNRNQSPSPTSGYNSSSAARTSSSTHRVDALPDATSVFVPQYVNSNFQTSSSSNLRDRQSTSSQSGDRATSGINEFVSKTNLVGNMSPSNANKSSVLGSLINPPRQDTNRNYNDFSN